MIEWLIRTIRQGYLDRLIFWELLRLTRKVAECQNFNSEFRVQRSLNGITPAQCVGAEPSAAARSSSYVWRQNCEGRLRT